MKAEIITIGDEILIGQIVDTNSQWIGKELNKIGVSVYQISSVQDSEDHILNALKEAQARVDIVLVTGGLGPTKDDITKKTIAKYFNDDTFVYYPEVFEHIKQLLGKYNHPVKDIQKYQAKLPSTATLLFNQYGTAPGMWFEKDDTVFVSMPGVPSEMKGIMQTHVLPRVQQKFNLPFIVHRTIHTFGQGESVIAERIATVEDNLPNYIKLAYLPAAGKVRLRLSGKHSDQVLLNTQLNVFVEKIQELIPDIISGVGEQGVLEEYLGKLLKSKGLTVATAESMTAGKLASTMVSVSGASAYYKGSYLAYTSALKTTLLDVPSELIDKYTVVSAEVSEVMALSCREKLDTDYAISITGNAGPSTDENTTEVGQVFIGIASKEGSRSFEFNFGSPREKVIERTVIKAMELLVNQLN